MTPTSRRRFVEDLLALIPAYAALGFLFEHDLFAAQTRPAAYRWLLDVQEASRSLSGGRLRPAQWQAALETLFGGVTLPEMLRLVDFDRLAPAMERPSDRAAARKIELPAVEGLPEPAAFFTKVFALGPDVAIVPHGHRNMASMHVVLSGEIRLRHFDRVQDEAGHMLIRPTIDRTATPGDFSSISSQKDNIHWLANTGAGPAYTLDIIVDNLDPTLGFPYRMDFVDVAGGEKAEGDMIRAPRVSFERALALYGPAGIRR